MGSQGVVVMEVLTDAPDSSTLQGWPGASYDYWLMRTEPMAQVETDFGSDMDGYPMLPVIDLQTMQVLKVDCFYENWESCIGAFL